MWSTFTSFGKVTTLWVGHARFRLHLHKMFLLESSIFYIFFLLLLPFSLSVYPFSLFHKHLKKQHTALHLGKLNHQPIVVTCESLWSLHRPSVLGTASHQLAMDVSLCYGSGAVLSLCSEKRKGMVPSLNRASQSRAL